MSPDSARLKATLDELHQQLADVDELDPALRGQLTTTLDEIQTALAATRVPNTADKDNAASQSMVQRLRDAANDFEESHPAIAGTLGSLIDTLGRTGI